MLSTVLGSLRGLAHPRSRRGQLWACVYCGVHGDGATDTATAPPRSRAD